MVRDTYTDERYHNEYLRQQRAGAFSPVASIPDEQIDQALKKPWAQDGRHWSSRLWDHKEQLAGKLQGELTRVLIQGKSPVQAGKRLVQQLHVGENQAIRLMQTECTYIQTLADKESATKMGIKKMQYLATLEAHTCGTCGESDEKVFPVKDLIPGITAPPIHPHCRCTLVPYFEDEEGERWMREPESGESQTVHDMPFLEWEKKYIFTPKTKKSSLIIDDGYKVNDHKEELAAARIILTEFGGKLHVLQETGKFAEKTPDYEWNGMFWDLKCISSEKAADSAIRHGRKQIIANPGGIILKCMRLDFDMEKLKRIIKSRLSRYNDVKTSIIVISGNAVEFVVNSKKKEGHR